ncbi:uncharacterized protein [Phaseolus vulgaris]|uniref:uncharacterized protein n=1 Tax=Phaseolus vulgaris TaxID=3885 RepID=UPI0035CBD2CE
MIGWSVELSEFDIRYEPRGAIKSQCLANFSAELTPLPTLSGGWTLYVDDSSNKTACGAGVVLEGPDDLFLEQAFQFGFRATNNQAEYEALLAGLNLAYDMGAREVTCKSDSQVMVGQVNGDFEVKEPLLQRYYHAAKNSIARFSKAPLQHIPREDNKRADILSKLSVTKKKSHQRSVIQIWLRHPSVTEADAECLAIEEEKAEADNWTTPVIQYLTDGTCKAGQEKAMKQQCTRYTCRPTYCPLARLTSQVSADRLPACSIKHRKCRPTTHQTCLIDITSTGRPVNRHNACSINIASAGQPTRLLD